MVTSSSAALGMERDRGVELRFGRAHLHRYRHDLDDLAGFGAEHVAAEHPVGLRIDDQLEQRAFVAARQGVLERTKTRFVDVDA